MFLQREAFDRIEAMRSNIFFSAAIVIHAMVRGKMCHQYYLKIKAAIVVVQSFMRMVVCKSQMRMLKKDLAAIVIHKTWRMVCVKFSVWQCYLAMKEAACIIQFAFRRYRTKIMHHSHLVERRVEDAAVRIQALGRAVCVRIKYQRSMDGVTRTQAMFRGIRARKEVYKISRLSVASAAANAAAERAATERAMAEKSLAERAAAERVVTERATAERAAVERAAAEIEAAEREASERAAAEAAAAA